MTTTLILKQTARVILANPLLYFLCAVGVFIPSLLGLFMREDAAPSLGQFLSELLIVALCLPALAVTTWCTACFLAGRPIDLSEALSRIRARLVPIFSVAILTQVTFVPFMMAVSAFTPLIGLLALVAFVLFIYCSIALPVAFLEDLAAIRAFTTSIRRLQGYWCSTALILLCGALPFIPMSWVAFLAPERPWVLTIYALVASAIVQVLTTAAMTCLYLHVSPTPPILTMNHPDLLPTTPASQRDHGAVGDIPGAPNESRCVRGILPTP